MKFQFQYGAIKRKYPFGLADVFAHFNSNMVRLRETLSARLRISGQHFNSNMVRLRDVLDLENQDVYIFQFQYGAIKSV